MTARTPTGKGIADRLVDSARISSDALLAEGKMAPGLAVIMAGRDPSVLAYLERLESFAVHAGVRVGRHSLSPQPSLRQVSELISRLNEDPDVHGILPLVPLGQNVELARVAELIDPAKDVDGLHPLNVGRAAGGLGAFVSCTARGAVALAEFELGDLRGMVATVVGASSTVGRPLAELLVRRGVTVTIAHADTRNLPEACKASPLLFVAAGRAALITDEHVRPGALVIDIGINQVGSRLVGDVDLEAVRELADAVSAVPDGVGPVTTAYLMVHTVEAAIRFNSARATRMQQSP